MKIFLTGHRGFIGSNMLQVLQDNGHEVTCYDLGDKLPNVEGHDWAIHMGAITSTTELDSSLIKKHNIEFSNWLLKECDNHGVNLQYSSSASVYGIKKERIPFKETDQGSPVNLYAKSKYIFELHTQLYQPKVIVQGFRYFNVYGPDEEHKGNQASPFYKFKKEFDETGYVTVFEGSHEFERDFIHVGDVCDYHMRFLNVKESGIWNIGSGRTIDFYTIALFNTSEEQIKVVPMPEELKNHYQEYTCADMTKTKETLRKWNAH